jgi:hypothetical protein
MKCIQYTRQEINEDSIKIMPHNKISLNLANMQDPFHLIFSASVNVFICNMFRNFLYAHYLIAFIKICTGVYVLGLYSFRDQVK